MITAAPLDDGQQHQVFVPPAAPISTTKARKGAAAAEVKAAAAKQRDAMRRDIQNRKQELLKKAAAGAGVGSGGSRSKAAGAGVSPLDDPIILVQNLPDFYQMMEPPSSASNTGNTVESSADASTLVSPPPAPVSTVVPVCSTDLDNDTDDGEDGDAEEEAIESEVPVSLEFERMVLQLKSVIESSALDDDELGDADDDANDDDDMGASFQPRIPEETEEVAATGASLSTTSPLPPAYSANGSSAHSSPLELKASVLQEPSFTRALQALLTLKDSTTAAAGETEVTAILSTVASEHRPALLWMRSYVTTLTTSSLAPPAHL